MVDYYEVLGVSKNASPGEIKTAYRKQALKWHPDRNKDPSATQRFKEINKAFEVLGDPKKKEMYDQYGADVFERPSGYPGGAGGSYSYRQGPFTYTYSTSGGENPFEGMDFGGFSDPFEIFEQFFGFQSPFGRARSHTRRSVYEMELSFDEAVSGVEKEAVIKGERRKIKIPAGVDSGNQIRFADFDIQVRVKPHPFFKREGQDVYMEKEISYPTAVLGGVIEVPTIKESVKIRVRPGTESGSALRLRGQGIPYPNSSQRGDQYVVFKVKTPASVSSKARKLLEELQREL